MTEAMRCLSVRQPWAWAIASGFKDIENRSWPTDYRGPVVIHASATKAVVNAVIKAAAGTLPTMNFSYGAFVGVADLVDVLTLSPDLECNPWAGGPYCWRIANARSFKVSIPAKGKLSLYALPKDASQVVRVALSNAEVAPHDERARAWADHLVRTPESERIAGLYNAYIQLGDGNNALRLAERGVELRENADAYADRAIARMFLLEPDHKAALVDLNRAIEIDPANGRVYRVRGLVHQELGMSAPAEADLARAKELGFDDKGLDDEAADGIG